jgi:hemerythrin superfamily protein
MLSINGATKTRNSNHKGGQEATALLKADHKLVDSLFKEYEATNSNSKKKQLVEKICKELTIHAQIEEEIFYPAVQKALKDHELVPEAMVEHGSLKELIAAVKDIEPNGDMYDAKIKVMSEYVKHHVKEEEKEMFPEAKGTHLDMTKLGALMAKRKQQLYDGYN